MLHQSIRTIVQRKQNDSSADVLSNKLELIEALEPTLWDIILQACFTRNVSKTMKYEIAEVNRISQCVFHTKQGTVSLSSTNSRTYDCLIVWPTLSSRYRNQLVHFVRYVYMRFDFWNNYFFYLAQSCQKNASVLWLVQIPKGAKYISFGIACYSHSLVV